MKMIVGMAVALLSGLGIGGGGLLVIYLVFFGGEEQIAAQGINLLFFVVSSAFALSIHVFKRKIPWKYVMLLSSVGMAAAIIGSFIAMKSDPTFVKKAFGVMLTFSGITAFFKK